MSESKKPIPDREPFLELFAKIIQKGMEKAGSFEVIFALIRLAFPRVLGTEKSRWDPYEEFLDSMSDYDTMFGLTQGDELKTANLRLALTAYCHILESDPPYVILANLLRCAAGEKFHVNPFGRIVAHIREQNKEKWQPDSIFDPKSPPLPIHNKFEYISSLAKKAGFPEVKAHIESFYDADIRNAFSHANYVFTEKSFRYFVNGAPQEMPWEELSKKLEIAFAFMQSLIGMVKSHRHQYYKLEKYHKLPNYEVLELVCEDEELTGFVLHFSNGHKAWFIRKSDGSYDAANAMIEGDGTVNFNCGLINALTKQYLINGEPFEEVVKRELANNSQAD